MDYEKKYKEILKRAKEKYPTCYSPALLEYIFPELKESEDKAIRKDIISNLKRYINCIKDGYDAPSAKDFVVKEIEKQIAWLEKQGDKDSQVKLPTFTFDDILALQCCMETAKKVQNDKDLYEKLNDLHGKIYDAYYLENQGDTNETINKDEFAQGVLKGAAINLITWIDYNAAEGNMCLSNMECKDVEDALVSGDWNKIYAYIKKKLESNEKKPQGKSALEAINEEVVDNAYKVETNQKSDIEKGKWYVCNTPRYTDFVVGKAYYCPKNGMLKPNEGTIARYVAKDCFHIWTIADAKEGDVLTWDDTSCVVLFKNIKNSKCFISYCFANDISFEIGTSHYIKGCHPATKEQRDLLFDKMKEDGYEWDAEKKELKKIDSEITIPFGAKDSELQEATYYIPKGFYAEIDDDKILIKKGEKPTAWSEDDERIKKRLINLVNEIYDNTNYITFLEHKELLAWLEKLDDNIEL